MNINLGVGRVQNVTAKNVFLKDKSFYEFIRAAKGKKYDDVYDFCDIYFDKKHDRKYFGQIITPINFLGLIQTDENEVLVENQLLEEIYNSQNERLASYYMNYFLCMWQYPIPSTQKNSGRDLKIFKPYLLLLKMLLELYKIDPKKAYLTTCDFSDIFLDVEENMPEIDAIDQVYAEQLLKKRTDRALQGVAQENGSLTYIINTLGESFLLTKDASDYPETDDFYIGLCNSSKTIELAEFVIRVYKKTYFRFDAGVGAGKREDMTEYCQFINNKIRFSQWRSCFMNISRVNEFKEYCVDKGFNYSDKLIRRFVLSLESKPFLLLTGISGSGKTKIAELWTRYLEEKDEAIGLQIAVGSNWTDNKKLLGFKNVLLDEDEAYQETQLVELIKNANNNRDKEYIVILDEMNLSRVEMYFADFLSALESMEHTITLPNDEKIEWSDNLKIIGTVNVDESTYMFSPKVLDRANVIEMNGVSPREYINGIIDSHEKIYNSIQNESWFDNYIERLEKLYQALGGEFAYRVIDEMTKYISLNCKMYGDDDFDRYLDEQICQKIMPKLHGSKAQLKPKLDRLEEMFGNDDFPLVSSKLSKMQEDVKKGYTSFIGD